MAWYKDLGGDSGIDSYNVGADRIIITFTTGASYEYTYHSAGIDHIENMKSLAKQGQGLNSYKISMLKKDIQENFKMSWNTK